MHVCIDIYMHVCLRACARACVCAYTILCIMYVYIYNILYIVITEKPLVSAGATREQHALQPHVFKLFGLLTLPGGGGTSR
jgi:hypothetical protein